VIDWNHFICFSWCGRSDQPELPFWASEGGVPSSEPYHWTECISPLYFFWFSYTCQYYRY